MKNITKILRSQLTLLKPYLAGCSLEAARKGQDSLGRLMVHTHRDAVTAEAFEIGHVPCAMITPKDELFSGVMLYLHGGGYVAGNLKYAKGVGTVLAAKCGIRVLCAAYRLAPEHVYPAAVEDAFAAYEYLLAHGYAPSQILLCGESAGGGLVYALCFRLKQRGRPMPAGIVAISPWTDLTMSGASYETNKQTDPSMTRERLKFFADSYAYGGIGEGKGLNPLTNGDGEEDARIKRNPEMSPLFGDLEGMPPSLIFVGGDEIMLDDATALHRRLLEVGSESELTVAPRMWHGYLLYALKEHEKDFDKIRRFIKNNLLHKKLRWMSLDNAAKIFPAARRWNWSNVFRLSATMTEEVDVDALRVALDVTVRRFPSIAARLKVGVFWYYLEEIPHAPALMEEKPYPLSRMIFDDIRKCAFRVIVYKRRIAVEFFHALTDGNGGLVFLKTLVAEYILQRYGVTVPCGNGILDRLEEPSEAELEDSFQKYAGPAKAPRADTDAYRISGVRDVDGFRTNTTFRLDAAAVAAAAKARGVTVTAYMASALILATCRIQDARVRRRSRHRPVKICIPVNLRKLFPSETLRNFVLYASPGIDPQLGEYTFDEICKIIHHQMQLQITPKRMAAMIATNVGDEKPFLLRATPLFLKNIVMKMIFDAVGEKKTCFTLSNLGVVVTPPAFSAYVERLDFVLGVQSNGPYNTSLITYNGQMNLNVIRNIREPLLERELHRVLKDQGLRVRVESNARKENENVLY